MEPKDGDVETLDIQWCKDYIKAERAEADKMWAESTDDSVKRLEAAVTISLLGRLEVVMLRNRIAKARGCKPEDV